MGEINSADEVLVDRSIKILTINMPSRKVVQELTREMMRPS